MMRVLNNVISKLHMYIFILDKLDMDENFI